MDRKSGLLKILKSIQSMPAKFIFYGSSLLAIAVISGNNLPPELAIIASTIGVNSLSSLLDRVAQGESVKDDEIQKIIQTEITNSNIEKLLTDDNFQRSLARVFRKLQIIEHAIKNNEFEIKDTLITQFEIYDGFWKIIKDDIESIRLQQQQILNGISNITEISESTLSIIRNNFPIDLINNKALEDLDRIKKARFFWEFDKCENSKNLAEQILSGRYQYCSDEVKSHIFAWLSRILIYSNETFEAKKYLNEAKKFGNSIEIDIAQAFAYSTDKKKEKALSLLTKINIPSAISASLLIIAYLDGTKAAVEWLDTAGYKFADLDSDGKYQYLNYLVSNLFWEKALKYVKLINEDDFIESPALYDNTARILLAYAVPESLRADVYHFVPFAALNFPLNSDMTGLELRNEAKKKFYLAKDVAEKYSCADLKNLHEEYIIWLDLMDPHNSRISIEILEKRFQIPSTSLHLVYLAFQFGVNVNYESLEREIEIQITRCGGENRATTIAKFILFINKNKGGEKLAAYIGDNFKELSKHFNASFLLQYEIELFSAAGKKEKAKKLLLELRSIGIDQDIEERLDSIIAANNSKDYLELLEKQFDETQSIGYLSELIDNLEQDGRWIDVCNYGMKLFTITKSVFDFRRLLIALNKTQNEKEIIRIVQSDIELYNQIGEVRSLYPWALYYEGRFIEAEKVINELDIVNEDYRHLKIKITIANGNWDNLGKIIINAIEQKELLESDELLRFANIAMCTNLPYIRKLLTSAVSNSGDNPSILVNAFFLAAKAGFENEDEIGNWLHTAAELSSENGPLYKKNIKDLFDYQIEFQEKRSDIWNDYKNGTLPISLVAEFLNVSILELTLSNAIKNFSITDTRRRSIIPAFSGAITERSREKYNNIGLDDTSLITLGYLGLIDKVIDSFETIYLPHSIMMWLFNEKDKLRFHQPSQIKKAKYLNNLIAKDIINVVKEDIGTDDNLSNLIGKEMSVLISYTKQNHEYNGFVVRPAPVHIVSPLMNEEADLHEYYSILSSCKAIVEKLMHIGVITTDEANKAIDYIGLQEKPWAEQPIITEGASLYLDNLAIELFYETKLLEVIHKAKFRIYISESVQEKIIELIEYEEIIEKSQNIIDDILPILQQGIKSEKIQFGPLRRSGKDEEYSTYESPTRGIFSLVEKCQAIVIDDRFFNKNDHLDDNGETCKILTSLDLLTIFEENNKITIDEKFNYLTKLRRAGFLFIPISQEELDYHLPKLRVTENIFIENAELKAIRESILKVRMTDILQFPIESNWLDNIIRNFIKEIKAIWLSDIDIESKKLRSIWLYKQINLLEWVHLLEYNDAKTAINFRISDYAIILIKNSFDMEQLIKSDYLQWIELSILIPLTGKYPHSYQYIIEHFKNFLENMVNNYLSEDGGGFDYE